MLFVLISGVFLMAISLAMIINPELMARINKLSNKIVFTDSSLFVKPVISGILFILLGTLLIWAGLYQEIIILACLGIPGVVTGLIFVIRPALIIKINKIGNKVVFKDESIMMNPRITGFVILPVSIYLVYLAL